MKKIGYGFAACLMLFLGVGIVRAEESYSEAFKKIAPNNIYTPNAVKPASEIELGNTMYTIAGKMNAVDGSWVSLGNCNESFTVCDLEYFIPESNGSTSETHTVTVKWAQPIKSVKAQVDKALSQIDSNYVPGSGQIPGYWKDAIFNMKDLETINYYVNYKEGADAAAYSKELTKAFDNMNVTYGWQVGKGDIGPFFGAAGGSFSVYYGDVLYGSAQSIVDIYRYNVIYIPDDTANTKEAYIAAAKKRIEAYLGYPVKIEVAGKINDYIADWEGYANDFFTEEDQTNMGDYYYNITLNNQKIAFAFVKDSSKVEVPVVETKDGDTNISISTEVNLPMDTTIQVKVVKKESKEFKTIEKALNIKNSETVQVYDFKLFSKSADKFITKLATGEFKVSVPVNDKLKGKKLAAYYVDDKGKVEVYDVVEVHGIATFKTSHFSIYTIAEKTNVDVKVPATFDNIMIYIILGIIGLVGMTYVGLTIKKKDI